MTAANDLSTTSYAKTISNQRNLIIGGNFTTNPFQRGISFAATANGQYIADKFKYVSVGAGVVTCSQNNTAPLVGSANLLTINSLKVDVTTADASIAASDIYAIRYGIEGYDFTNIAQRAFIVSFWAYATVTGTYSVGFRNSGTDRYYIGTFTVSTTNTFEYKTISVPASPATGTWSYTNGLGLEITWIMAAGSDFHGTVGTWTTGALLASSSQVNNMATIGNVFIVNLIQVESGTVATPFQIRSVQQEISLCQRYYEKTYSQGAFAGTNTATGSFQVSNSACLAGAFDSTVRYKVEKRTAATPIIYAVAGTSGKVTQDNTTEITATVANEGTSGFRLTGTNGASRFGAAGHFEVNADF